LEARLYHPEYRIRLMTAAAMGVLSRIFPGLRGEARLLLGRALPKEKNAEVLCKIKKVLAEV